MSTWIKIALRNLLKNARRSLITILAIAFGFAALSLFAGFMDYMYLGNRVVAVYASWAGQLTIFKKGYEEQGQADPGRYLMSPDEIRQVEKICRGIPEVRLVAPQLRISGLLSNGRISTIFIANGVEPSAVRVFLDAMRSRLKPRAQEALEQLTLSDEKPYQVAVASGLARILDLKQGDSAVAFTTTVDGQMNALDVEVANVFDSPTEAVNDKLMRVSLQFARSLFYTQGADRVGILLDHTEDTEQVQHRLQQAFTAAGLDLQVKTWEEMSEWYRRVKDLFDVIFAFLFSIVLVIVMMSVVNTMGMAVLERIREIGTLRALGLKRRGVLLLFGVESVMLGLLGSLAGSILTLAGWFITDVVKPTWTPPNMLLRVPIQIQFVPDVMLISALCLMVLCVTVSLIPARRAIRKNIVEALGHV